MKVSVINILLSIMIPCNSFIIKSKIYASVNNPSNVIKDIGTLPGQRFGTWGYSEFINNLNNKNIDAVTIVTNQDKPVSIYSIDVNHELNNVAGENIHVTKLIPDLFSSALQNLDKNHINYDILDVTQSNFFDNVPFIFQIAGLYIFTSFFINIIFRGRMMSSQNNPMQNNFMNPLQNLMKSDNEVDTSALNVTFDDVAGCIEAKYELMEVVDFLKNPLKFSVAGAKIPKGVLLEGPPGTGKTLLARAVAGEAGVSFFQASGSQFIEMFVGVGASRVRDLFNKANENSPCVIFIDEIDAIGRQRGTGLAGGNDEREQTLNQILTNMDGFIESSGIIVLAATNRADILDAALTRPGRFDRKVMVGLPDKDGRREIMDVHFKNKNVNNSKYLDTMATLTSGFSGADIANLANEAAILSVRNNETSITNNILYKAYEKITIGLPQENENRPKEVLELVANHEIGHAMMVLLFKDMFDIQKVTIQSNKNGAGGYTLFTPNESYANFPSKKFLLANMIVSMGGRAAESVYLKHQTKKTNNYNIDLLFPGFNDLDVTTGASNDLKQVNNIARKFVSLYGLGQQIGIYDSSDSGGQPFLGRELAGGGNKLSEYSKVEIDKEIKHLVQYAYYSAVEIINTNKLHFEELVILLLDKGTINGEELNKYLINYK